MQPIPKMQAVTTFVRRFIRKFQIKNTGSRAMVKSVMAAPTLYTYTTARTISKLIQESNLSKPGLSEGLVQKELTGWHSNMKKKRGACPR